MGGRACFVTPFASPRPVAHDHRPNGIGARRGLARFPGCWPCDLAGRGSCRAFDDPRADPLARASLRARAEVLKVALSSKDESSIELNDIARGEGGSFLPATFSMRRADLERIAQPLIDRTLETCRFSIETIGLRVDEIQRVILVGGSTRMPLVVSKVEGYFKRPATGRVKLETRGSFDGVGNLLLRWE